MAFFKCKIFKSCVFSQKSQFRHTSLTVSVLRKQYLRYPLVRITLRFVIHLITVNEKYKIRVLFASRLGSKVMIRFSEGISDGGLSIKPHSSSMASDLPSPEELQVETSKTTPWK